MENNKAYLQKIHLVFLVCVVCSVISFFLFAWTRTSEPSKIFRNSPYFMYFLGMYVGLGIITKRWKSAFIALGTQLIIFVLGSLIINKQTADILLIRLVFYIINGSSVVVFFSLKTGWKKNFGTILFAALVLPNFFYWIFHFTQGIGKILDPLEINSYTWGTLTYIISGTAVNIFTIISLCELNNLIQGKKDGWKTTLLNPGNEYDKLKSLLVFWMLKVMFLVIIVGCSSYIINYNYLISRYYQISSPIGVYYRFIGFIEILSFIATGFMLVWYMRKFLLEYFISYNISSKFLYWISLFPFIGSFLFAILQLHDAKQGKYEEKVHAIGNFAASSSTAITTLFIIIMLIRLVFRIESGGSAFIVSIIVGSLLFLWFTADKKGYYTIQGLNGLLLTAGLIVIAIGRWGSINEIAIVFSLITFNLFQIALTFPVYHFGEFVYIPSKNEEIAKPETDGSLV